MRARRADRAPRPGELTIRRIVDVGGWRFFVISGGDLDGWAVRADARHTVSIEVEAASAE